MFPRNDGSGPVDTVEIYQIATDTWDVEVSLPAVASTMSLSKALTIGNHVYFANGVGIMAIYRPEMSDAQKWEVKSVTGLGGKAFIEVKRLVKIKC